MLNNFEVFRSAREWCIIFSVLLSVLPGTILITSVLRWKRARMASTTEAERLLEVERATSQQLKLIANKMAAAVTRCTRDLRYAWVSPRCAEWIQRPPRTNHRQKDSRSAWNRSFPQTAA